MIPQLSKPEATAARNQNSIGDRMEKKPWEKPGSVGGASSPLARRTSSLFQLQQSQSVSGPLVTEHAAQLLVQALVISRLDYCNALLAGLPSNTIKPLQMIQNASSRAAWSSTSPCYTSLCLLALATRCSSHSVQDTHACTGPCRDLWRAGAQNIKGAHETRL